MRRPGLLLGALMVFASATAACTGHAGTTTEKQEQKTERVMETDKMKLHIGGKTFTATMEDNASAQALLELLANGDVTIEMEDYANMEKVGPIGTSLPRTDRQTTTSAGDIILYQGKPLQQFSCVIPDSAVTRGEFLVYVIDNHAAYIVIRLQHVEKHCAAAYKRLDICNIFPFTEPCRKKCPELRYKLAFTAHPLQKRFSLCHYCIALCKDT